MKLPVLATVVEAYRILFANLGTFVRLFWFPAAVGFAAAIVARHYLPSIRADGGEDFELFGVSLEVIALLFEIPAITAWYRLVLLGDGDGGARIRYSVRVEEWRYLLRVCVLLLVFLVALVFLFSFVWLVPEWQAALGAPVVEAIFVAVSAVIALFAAVPFLFVLPSAAVGKSITFLGSVRAMKGNIWRLYIVYVIAFLPILFEYTVIDFLFFGNIAQENTIYPISYIVIEFAVYWFFYTISASSVALAYRALVSATATYASASQR